MSPSLLLRRRLFDKCSRLLSVCRAKLRVTDVSRWRRNAREQPWWDIRNQAIAQLIPPHSTVLDLGAGAQTLKGHLPPGCKYQPADIAQKTPDTLHCDFNRGEYPPVSAPFDVTVVSGVLEYVVRPKEFLQRIRPFGKTLILSYNCRAADERQLDRLNRGWLNHLSLEELERLLEEAGFRHEVAIRKDMPGRNELVFRAFPAG